MVMQADEIYKELEKLQKHDLDNIIKKSKTIKERTFWMKIRECLYNEKPKTIYHYTSLPALEGILLEGKLRLFRSDGMNDKAEMHNFIDLLEKSVCKRIRQKELQDIIKREFKNEMSNRKQEITYIISFSTWKDDVSQWERYGNNGYGVAIAFDYKTLRDLAQPCMLRLQEVFYGENADNHQLIDMLEPQFRSYDFSQQQFGINEFESAFDNAWAVSAAHKHYSFASEREYRLVTLPTWKGKRYDKLGNSTPICTPSAIKECINFDWRQQCIDNNVPVDKLIVGITIGPKSRVKRKELQKYLKDIGFDCLIKNVKLSKSTLR